MICKNCSAEFDDSVAQCPECGMENETVTEGFGEKNEPAEAFVEATDESVAEQHETEASFDEKSEEEESASSETAQEEPEEKESEEKMPEAPVRATRPIAKRPAKKRPADGRNIKRRPAKPTKQEKRMMTVIMVIMCFIGVCAVVTATLNITTDIFRVDTSANKLVAGVGLASAEEKQLEELLAKSYSVIKGEFGSEGTCAETIIARINPSDKGNIYSRINDVTEKLQKTPDPADRFVDENGEYAYYKLSEKNVDKVLECFGIESYRGENGKGYYYCDGYYYVAHKESNTQLFGVEVTKTKRILDGSYYAEFCFYIENDGKVRKSKPRYLLLGANKDEATGDTSFVIKRTSQKDIVGADGKLKDSVKTYERKTEVIEGYTKDGTLFCKYVIDYPVLTGEQAGCKNVNDMLENTVSVYKMKLETVDADYKRYKAAGGEKDKLPFVENVVAEVVFENDKNVSFVEKIYRLDPVAVEKSEEEEDGYTEQETVTEVRLYDVRVESYTVEKQSGNFVSKDSVVGKDYMLASEVLYRIYNGYEYDRVLPGYEGDDSDYYYDETPSDTDGVGEAIYESSWARTKSGITFWYKTEQGYLAEVTMPSKVAKELAK